MSLFSLTDLIIQSVKTCVLGRPYTPAAEDGYPIAQVADLLGFADQSNFFRVCKRWFGLPSAQYRRALVSPDAVALH